MSKPDDVVHILPEGNLTEDLSLIESGYVKEAMMQLQELPREDRRTRNQNFVESITAYKDGNQEEGFMWMNDNLHGSTCKQILSDIDYKGGCKDKTVEKLEDTKDSIRDCLGCAAAPRADGWSFGSILKRIKSVIIVYFDLLKDILVCYAVFNVVKHMNADTVAGAIDRIVSSFDFPSVLVLMLFMSIVIPIAVSAISMMFRDPTIFLGGESWHRLMRNKPSFCKIVVMKIFVFVFYVMMPAILINTREVSKSRLQVWIESKREETKKNAITVAHLNRIRKENEYLEETRVAFLIFKRNELTLENVLQLFLQGVFVLLSPTYTAHTSTNSGLQSVFKEKNQDCGDLSDSVANAKCQVTQNTVGHVPLRILLILSVMVSIKTTASTYVKIKTEEKIKFFPLLSKLFLALRALVAYSARAVCIVGFFVPFLGLLDVLAHWKAEQSNEPLDNKTRTDFCNRRPNDDELAMGRCPYSKYTGVTLGVAFGFFMLGLFIQTGTALIVKMAMNKQFRKTTFASKLHHIALIINLPDNYGDWTSGGGSLDELRKRQKMHLVEISIMILLQFISHMLMTIPFYVTGKNANKRQEILMDKARIFDEETEALEFFAYIYWVLPLAIVVTSLIDLFMVIAFQKWFHPWRRIIAKPKEEKMD